MKSSVNFLDVTRNIVDILEKCLENCEKIFEEILRKFFKRFQRCGELKKTESNFEVKKMLIFT